MKSMCNDMCSTTVEQLATGQTQLSPEQLAHVDGCPACWAGRELPTLIDETRLSRTVHPGPGFSARVVAGAATRIDRRRKRRRHLQISAGTAAAVAAAAAAAVLLINHGPGNTAAEPTADLAPAPVPTSDVPSPARRTAEEPTSDQPVTDRISALRDTNIRADLEQHRPALPAGPGDNPRLADLSPERKQRVMSLLDTADKEATLARARLRVLELELKQELETSAPDESKVERAIDAIGAVENKARKSQLLAWVRVRRLLSGKETSASRQSPPRRPARPRRPGRPDKLSPPLDEKEPANDPADTLDPFGDSPTARAPDVELGDLCGEKACALDPSRACCDKFSRHPKGRPTVPQHPSRADVTRGVQRIRGQLMKCGTQHRYSGKLTVRMRIGSGGRVVVAAADSDDPALNRCVESALRRARFPRSVEGLTVRYPFVLR